MTVCCHLEYLPHTVFWVFFLNFLLLYSIASAIARSNWNNHHTFFRENAANCKRYWENKNKLPCDLAYRPCRTFCIWLLAFVLHLQYKGADCLEVENRLGKKKKKKLTKKNQKSKIQISSTEWYMQQLSSSKFMQRVQKQVTSLIPSASIENFDKNRQAKTKKTKNERNRSWLQQPSNHRRLLYYTTRNWILLPPW